MSDCLIDLGDGTPSAVNVDNVINLRIFLSYSSDGDAQYGIEVTFDNDQRSVVFYKSMADRDRQYMLLLHQVTIVKKNKYADIRNMLGRYKAMMTPVDMGGAEMKLMSQLFIELGDIVGEN